MRDDELKIPKDIAKVLLEIIKSYYYEFSFAYFYDSVQFPILLRYLEDVHHDLGITRWTTLFFEEKNEAEILAEKRKKKQIWENVWKDPHRNCPYKDERCITLGVCGNNKNPNCIICNTDKYCILHHYCSLFGIDKNE